MEQHKKIAVLGGSGRTGHYLVTELLNRGFHVTCLVRHPEKLAITSPMLTVLQGNGLDENAVRSLVANSEAVMNTIGQRKGEPLVSSASTHIIIQAMELYHVKRYIALTGVSIDVPGDRKKMKTRFSSSLMRLFFSEIIRDKQHAFELLKGSTLAWTLLRVPFIEFKEAGNSVVVDHEDCPGTKVSAGDIADFMINQLSDTRYVAKAPFIANGK